MNSFLGQLGQGIVQASPFALKAVHDQEARNAAKQQALLAQLHQQSLDNTASVNANIQAGVGLANIGHINAQTDALRNPQTGVKTITDADGNIRLVPTKVGADVTAVTPVSTGIKAPPPKPVADPLKVTVDGKGRRVYTPSSQAGGMTAPSPSVAPDNAVVAVQMPDGSQKFVHRADAVGQSPVNKSGGMTGGMGSGGIGGLARTSGAITGMGVAHDQMAAYENSVKAGQANYNGLDHFQGQLASMFDAHGVLDQAKFSAALSQLNKTNPGLSNYLRAGATWALEDSQLSGRASDFRTRLDDFVSAIGPNSNPATIDNIQKFRQTRIDELKKFQPAMQDMANRAAGGGRGRGAVATGEPPPNYPGAPPATGPVGDLNLGGTPKTPSAPVTAKAVSPDDLQKAKAAGKEAEFRAWAKANGYSVP